MKKSFNENIYTLLSSDSYSSDSQQGLLEEVGRATMFLWKTEQEAEFVNKLENVKKWTAPRDI